MERKMQSIGCEKLRKKKTYIMGLGKSDLRVVFWCIATIRG